MSRARAWLIRLVGVLRRDWGGEDFAAEVEAHIQLHVDDNVRAGMSPGEARRAALLKFGSVQAVREAHRDRRVLPLIDARVRDTRFALRSIGRQPLFALTAILSQADVADRQRLVVIGDRFWNQRFGRSLEALGQQLVLDGRTFTILGVMPPGVDYPEASQLWVPSNSGTQIMGPSNSSASAAWATRPSRVTPASKSSALSETSACSSTRSSTRPPTSRSPPIPEASVRCSWW